MLPKMEFLYVYLTIEEEQFISICSTSIFNSSTCLFFGKEMLFNDTVGSRVSLYISSFFTFRLLLVQIDVSQDASSSSSIKLRKISL